MKDIDFDELDKAVSSLLGNKDEQKPASPTQSAAVPTTVTPPATPAAPEPAQPTSSTAPSVPPREPATTVSAPAARRSGRFMDVVHPSSDMAQTDKEPEHQQLAGSGRKLQPINRDVKPDPVEPKEETKKEADQPVPQKLSVVPDADPKTLVSTPDTNDTVWPDPLDVQPAKLPDDTADTTKEDKPDETPKTGTASPFLSDAKVEKRPLGAFSDQPKSNEPNDAPTDSTTGDDLAAEKPTTEDDTQVPAMPSAPSTEDMPPELDQKVVEVEATERGDDTAAMPEPQIDLTETTTAEPTTPATSTPPVNVTSMSIPQQYKSTERPAKEADRPVFDTKDYHAPIQAPARKKSGMGQWILLTILLVVAVGGAIYWLLYLR